MKFTTNQRIVWTSLELKGLLEEDDSCVHVTRTTKHLALHPFYLKNFQRALNEILTSHLNTYDTELKGFLMAYKNPKLLSNLGDTFYDSCFIHVDIEADFYLFCPKVGCSLKGIANKKGLDHIVLLVHKIFNVTIPRSDNEQEEWLGDTVEIGQEIKCHMTQIDRSVKPPSICAALNTDYLQGCRLSGTFNITYNSDKEKKRKHSLMSATEDVGESFGVQEAQVKEEPTDDSKKRKKKKRSSSAATEDVAESSGVQEVKVKIEPTDDSKKKKKKRSLTMAAQEVGESSGMQEAQVKEDPAEVPKKKKRYNPVSSNAQEEGDLCPVPKKEKRRDVKHKMEDVAGPSDTREP